MENRTDINQVFYFFNASKEIKEKVNNGRIPSGYYTSQDSWCITRYWFQGVEPVEGAFFFEGEQIGSNTQVYIF